MPVGLHLAGAGMALGMAAAPLVGCGSARHSTDGLPAPPALMAQSRPIGRGAAFHPPVSGPLIGPCQRALGRRFGVHVELFAFNRVVIVAAGIGTTPPRSYSEGRISGARCYGDAVTLEPTGVVLIRPGARLRLADLFRSWGQPLSARRMASFSAPARSQVALFVDGRGWRGAPGAVPLSPHSEIVAEVGPYVPPHAAYTFPPGA